MEPVTDRLGRALRLEHGIFSEIAADERSTTHGLLIAAVAFAISNLTGGEGNVVGRIIGGAVGGVIGLFVWTGLLFLLSRLFRGEGTYIELVRGIGYTAAPFALGVVPFLGLVGAVYSAVMQIRTVEETQRLSTGTAVAVVLIPWVLFVVIVFIALAALVSMLFGLNVG